MAKAGAKHLLALTPAVPAAVPAAHAPQPAHALPHLNWIVASAGCVAVGIVAWWCVHVAKVEGGYEITWQE